MWLIFSLLAPLFFAIVHVLDAYCVEDVFEEPWMGVVIGAISSVVIIFGTMPYIVPFISLPKPSLDVVVLAVLAGVLIQGSQALYFQSLAYSEAGIVGAYWNLIPLFIPIISFALLGELLAFREYLGIAILTFASTFILLLDSNKEFRTRSLILMIMASLLQAIAYIMLDQIYELTSFILTFYLMTLGLVLSGLTPICFRVVRKKMARNLNTLLKAAKFFILIEVANILALFFAQRAVDLGNPALVAAIETTIPAFTIMLSIFLLGLTQDKYGDVRARINFQWKIYAVSVMCIGVLCLS